MEFTRDEIDTAIKDIEDERVWANRFTIDKTKGYARSLTVAIEALRKLKEETCDREIQKKLYGADMPKETYEKYIDMLNKKRGIK